MSATRERMNVTHTNACRGLLARAVVTAFGLGIAGLCNPVLGQDAAKDPPPLDVNAIQPGAGVPATTPAKSGTEAAATAPVDEGPAYSVSRFVLEYKTEHPNQPSLEEVAKWRVKLGVSAGGFVDPRDGLPTLEVRIGDIQEGAGGNFYRSGINEVCKGIVAALNDQGLIGISVQMHPEDIDENTGADKRGGARAELRVIVWTGKVGQVRTISSGDRLASGEAESPTDRIDSDDAVQMRVRNQSPLQPGDLLHRDRIDNYVARLNRHPGRRVDVAISPGSEPEQVVVDYLVAESKPWSLYAQLSNTGTSTTAEWRERFGFVHNQLSGHDDVLRIDYTTAGFSASHALLLSYEFPILSDRVRLRTFGSYTEFTASDVGNSTDDFEGETVTLGAEVIGTVWQHREAFLDVYGGLRWKTEQISETGGSGGDENFFIPYLGVRFERYTEAVSTYIDLGLEAQWSAISDIDERDIQELGRPEVSNSWEVVKFSAEHSMFLEPLINPGGYRGDEGQGPTTLAHELVASVRGQYAFGYRLIASEEDIAGGMFTVRGYPESVIAGDSLVVASLEYRFHLPRALGVEENPGTLLGKRIGMFGNNFRWQPQQNFGRADWDFILKGFIDAAKSRNGKGTTITEDDYSLVGAGLGLELQVKRNFTMRLDWGFALQDLDDPANEISAGDNRVHFSVTVLY
ncbi:MAG: hypothetical protein HBSAPP03_25070 [Phycisphaerae bacterium]|nr:MAG: hypothetical protein HBSAPP03_25070 [Phycisphaerae bacterium]